MSIPSHRSTRGASKQRRDHINIEIQRLRDMLPLAESVKDRLFQLQVMSLACIYIRKYRYAISADITENSITEHTSAMFLAQTKLGNLNYTLPNCDYLNNNLKGPTHDVCHALRGFLIMMTRLGKLLYISENVSDYLGHSVEEIMSQGDNIYDLVDVRDIRIVQNELVDGPPSKNKFPVEKVFVCRINCNRTVKRHMQYQKFILCHGRYLQPTDQSASSHAKLNQSAFAAHCTPLINPDNVEFLLLGSTQIFRTVHLMDMTIVHMDDIGSFYLGYSSDQLQQTSWYSYIHPEDTRKAAEKHKLVASERETSVLLMVRLRTRSKTTNYVWLHTILSLKEHDSADAAHVGVVRPTPMEGVDNRLGLLQQPNVEMGNTMNSSSNRHYIVAVYQILSDTEATALRQNEWLYEERPHAIIPACTSINGEEEEDEEKCLSNASTCTVGYVSQSHNFLPPAFSSQSSNPNLDLSTVPLQSEMPQAQVTMVAKPVTNTTQQPKKKTHKRKSTAPHKMVSHSKTDATPAIVLQSNMVPMLSALQPPPLMIHPTLANIQNSYHSFAKVFNPPPLQLYDANNNKITLLNYQVGDSSIKPRLRSTMTSLPEIEPNELDEFFDQCLAEQTSPLLNDEFSVRFARIRDNG